MRYSRFEDLPDFIQSYISDLVADRAAVWVAEPVPALGGRSFLQYFSEESFDAGTRYLGNVGTKFGLPLGVEDSWLSKCVEGIIGPALERLQFVPERGEPKNKSWTFIRRDETKIKITRGLRIIKGAHPLDCPGGLIVELISTNQTRRSFEDFVRKNDPQWNDDRYDMVNVADEKKVVEAIASDLTHFGPRFVE